jgi:predicted branched-subunit amino acid permease
MWSTWQASTAVGVFVGAVIPKNLPLDFAITLTFIALLVPMLKDRASIIVSITAGIVALIATNFPLKLNLILAVFVAVAIGLSADRIEGMRR